MSVYFRGDPSDSIDRIRELPDGSLEVWMTHDGDNEPPLRTIRARLVADGGGDEIEALILRSANFRMEDKSKDGAK